MELFKTSVGSWTYPEPSLLRLGHVPLFSGFMYAAVGTYVARVWRIFDSCTAGQWCVTKLGVWSLLIIISFVLVSLAHRRELAAARANGLRVHDGRGYLPAANRPARGI